MKAPALVFAAAALAALAAAGFAPAASTDSYTFTVKLVPKGEVPASKGAAGAKGTFKATYVENATGAKLSWRLTFSGLTGKAMAAHIHKGKPGTSGPVVVPLCGPCKNGQKGSVQISKAVVKDLESADAYVNVHTAKNPGGEIRGQVHVPGA